MSALEPLQPAVLSAVATALRATTEALAHAVGGDATLAPDWSPFEWRIALASAALHGASGLLAGTPRWQAPQLWTDFLTQQRAAIAAHVSRGQELLGQIDAAARRTGLPLMALKGSALYAAGLYASGERPMADLDLLVAEVDTEACARLLTALGYERAWTTWKHTVFESRAQIASDPRALGEGAGHPLKVEVHTTLREVLPVRAVDLTALARCPPPAPGISTYPSDELRLLHVLLHAAGAMIHRGLRLVHLVDIARLVRPLTPPDWERLFATVKDTADPSLWWTYPPLQLANRYFDCVPAEILARLERACPWPLRRAYRRRRLTDVSLSALWISAFPGIEWSHSPMEMATYAARRLVPSRETRGLRATFANAIPEVHGGSWSQTSQAQRMLRWLLQRQPRQETLQPVRAALALPGL